MFEEIRQKGLTILMDVCASIDFFIRSRHFAGVRTVSPDFKVGQCVLMAVLFYLFFS